MALVNSSKPEQDLIGLLFLDKAMILCVLSDLSRDTAASGIELALVSRLFNREVEIVLITAITKIPKKNFLDKCELLASTGMQRVYVFDQKMEIDTFPLAQRVIDSSKFNALRTRAEFIVSC